MCLCHIDNTKVGIIFESAKTSQKKSKKKSYYKKS